MKKILQTPKDVYILYFHYWLSEAGLSEFSLTRLPPSMCASSAAITTTKKAMKKNDEQQQHNKAMQKQIKRLSNEMGNVTFISLTEKKDEWQERIMELELKVLEMDSVTQAHQIGLVRDCITQLHLNVRATDERLREMESNKKLKVDSYIYM